MRLILLLLIKLYWAMFPVTKNPKCIFRTSCSHHVYQITKTAGLLLGIKAFIYRFSNCRTGFHLFQHPTTNARIMVLRNKKILTEDEISERLLHRFNL